MLLEIFLGMNMVGQKAAQEAEAATNQEAEMTMAEARTLVATQVDQH
jgi:hypothetical protein